MIEWNRDIANYIQLAVVIIFFLLLIIKRKDLGEGILYFILAAGIVVGADSYILLMRTLNSNFNSFPIYSVAVNLFVFLFYFLYLRSILTQQISRQINFVTIVLFIATYIIFAIVNKEFFTRFPFNFYFAELVLLLINIFMVLREIFNSDKILNIKSYYPIWACIGLMALYLGITPLLIISHSVLKLMTVNIFFIILFLINIIGYSIMIAGIFFGNKLKKTREPLRN